MASPGILDEALRPKPLDPSESGWESFLRHVGLPGYAVRNVLTGNLEGAGRNVLDFVGNTVDAALPGDWIPEFSRRSEGEGTPNDLPEGSDLVGGMEPGFGKLAADIGLGLLTDPLTYLGVGAVTGTAKGAAKAAQAADAGRKALTLGIPFTKAKAVIPGSADALEAVGKGVSTAYGKLPQGAREGLETAGRNVRSVFGMSRLAPWAQKVAEDVRVATGQTADAQQAALRPILESITEDEGKALFRAISGYSRGDDGAAAVVRATEEAAPMEASRFVQDLTGSGARRAEDVLAANESLDLQSFVRPPGIDEMLGAVGRPSVRRSGAQVASPLDVAVTQQGGKVADLVRVDPDTLAKMGTAMVKHEDQVANIVKGLEAQGFQGEQLARLTDAARKWVDYTSTAFREGVERGTFERPIGADLLSESPQYAHRIWDQETGGLFTGGGSKASAARAYRTPEDVVEALNRGEKLEERLSVSAAARAAQEPTMVGKTVAAQGIVKETAKRAQEKLDKAPDFYTALRHASADKNKPGWEFLSEAERWKIAGLSEAEQAALRASAYSPLFKIGGESSDLAKAVRLTLDELSDPKSPVYDIETANAMRSIVEGLPPREGIFKLLAGGNQMFKRFATAGAFLPRINFTIRNVLTGGGFQMLTNEKTRPDFWKYAAQTPRIILRAFDDALEELTGTRMLRTENEFAAANAALAASRGSVKEAINLMPPGRVREAFEDGVIIGGFIDAEQLGQAMNTKGWRKWIANLRDWPAAMAKGGEQRMRFAAYNMMRDRGIPRLDAAKNTLDTFFNYNVNSLGNRRARDILPFFQFSAKAIPQSAKFFARNPGAMAAVRPLYTQDTAENPIYPYMQGQVNIPMGADEEGNQSYLSSLGLPFEVLSDIPNLSNSPLDVLRELRQGVVGQATPPLKTAFAALSGVDPYFGTPFMSYDKAPEALQAVGVPERGDIGRYYNALAGTGLIQPLASPVQYASQILDERRTPLESLLGATTGLRTVSVDEDRALQQAITDLLRSRPEIGQFTNFYQTSDDPEIQALLDALTGAKKRLREKRATQAVAE